MLDSLEIQDWVENWAGRMVAVVVAVGSDVADLEVAVDAVFEIVIVVVVVGDWCEVYNEV